MQKTFLFFVLFLITILKTSAQTEKQDRIKNSYLAAFGWIDESGVNYWAYTQEPKDKNLNLNQLIERHRNFMYSLSPETGKKAINSAVSDVMGREASKPEIDQFAKERKTYGQITTHLIEWLKMREKAGMNEYKQVIEKAYMDWNGSKISKSDLEKFRKLPVMRYIDWKNYFRSVSTNKKLTEMNGQRNVQSSRGLMYVKDVQLQVIPNLENEVKNSEHFKNITLQSSGLIGQAGGNIISNDGAGFVSTNSGTWVSSNKSMVISTGGGNVISTGGLN